MFPVAKTALPGPLKRDDESGTISDLVSVLVSSGDLFYEWDLSANELVWVGELNDVIGVADASSIAEGSAFLQRIHPEDLPRNGSAFFRHRALQRFASMRSGRSRPGSKARAGGSSIRHLPPVDPATSPAASVAWLSRSWTTCSFAGTATS